MKMLVGLRGTKEDLSLTGADWYRLPNATSSSDHAEGADVDEGDDALDETSEIASGGSPGGKRKKAAPRAKFTSGVSWIKVSFPSAKDPSWFDRYGDVSTCVVTIEADDDFVRMFDTKPKIYSILKVGSGEVERLRERVLKDLLEAFPQLEGENRRREDSSA